MNLWVNLNGLKASDFLLLIVIIIIIPRAASGGTIVPASKPLAIQPASAERAICTVISDFLGDLSDRIWTTKGDG